MKKLMITLMAAQALTLAGPAAHAGVVELKPELIADPALTLVVSPDANNAPIVNAFSGR